MRASLHKHLSQSGNKLFDDYLKNSYSLTDDASWLITQLRAEQDTDRLARKIAMAKHISLSTAKDSLYALFSQLAIFGGVHIYLNHSFSLGERLRFYISWRIRDPGSVKGFLRATGRAYGGIVLVLLLLFLPMRLYIGPGTIFDVYMWAPVLMFGSFAAHEAAHLLTARALTVRAVLLSNLGYMAIMYRRPGLRAARIIACSGPLVSGLLSMTISLLVTHGLISMLLAVIGIVHIANLLPLFADGKTTWRKDEKEQT